MCGANVQPYLTVMRTIVNSLLLVVALLIFSHSASAQMAARSDTGYILQSVIGTKDSLFSRETFNLAGTSLRYRKAEIGHSDDMQKPLLLIYLHGGSSRGNDNETQLKEAAVDSFYTYLTSRNIPATMIVPQCPPGGGWISTLRRVVNELAKTLISSGQVDAGRVYVAGGSMGGTGTWCQLSSFPNFYAAAMPVAGNPTGYDAAAISTTPVYAVMGTQDMLMDIAPVANMQSVVTEMGGIMLMDVENGWTHQNTCEWSYTRPRLDWLFAQRRKGEADGVSRVQAYVEDEVQWFTPEGRRVSRPTHGAYIKRNGNNVEKVMLP